MAVVHGSVGHFSLDNSSGTPVDLSAYTKSVTLDLGQDIHDITTFGVGSRQKVTGLKNASLSVTANADPTMLTHLLNLYTNSTVAATWSFVIGPAGSAGGSRRFTGEVILEGLPVEVNVEDVETIQASFQVTGAVTVDTF